MDDTRRHQITAGKSTIKVPTIGNTGVPDPSFFARLKLSGSSSQQAPTLQPPTSQGINAAQVCGRASKKTGTMHHQQAVYTDPAPNEFVKLRASDGQLELGGKLYFGAGANNYGLAAQKEFYGNVAYLRQLFNAYKSEGVNVIRTWCFADGRGEYERDGNGNPVTFTRPFPFQVVFSLYQDQHSTHACDQQEWDRTQGKFVYRDENIRQLDLVISEAKRVGIRIICALGNNFEQFGCAQGWY